MPQQQMYGTWNSPLSAKMLSQDMVFNDVQLDTDGKTLVWVERRAGKGVLVMQTEGDALRDITDASLPVSGSVGYGGGEFTVFQGQVYFASKGRLYKAALAGGLPRPITPDFGKSAAPSLSADGKWVAYVHTDNDVDGVVVVDSDGALFPQKLAYGTDFVMQPVWHPLGTHLAYIAWNHPNMPWNGTELRLITLAYGTTGAPRNAIEETLIGDVNTAIFQPQFSPDGRYLSYVSDVSGWSQLYLYDLGEGRHTQITQGEAEHGAPGWVQGMRRYGWTSDSSSIYYLRNQNAAVTLWRYDLATKAATRIITDPYTFLTQISVAQNEAAFIASAPRIPTRIIRYRPDELGGNGLHLVRRASTEAIPAEVFSNGETMSWTGHDGETAHGIYYPPTNPDYSGTGKPPLMVFVHGGPTSQRFLQYEGEVQFFATRGFAVLVVNHRGGTGYGKAYMNKHAGGWGIYDVQDSITGAKHLAAQGLADKTKFVIIGGSAGGYTVLQALVDAPKFFKAGVNLYGVANQFTLAMDTHKFEARYSDWLLGALPAAAAFWRDRSPIFSAHKIQDACIVFQGAEDNVVPPSQSEAIVAALKRNGVPHEYIVYEGEGHGFRKPETLEDYYTKALRFLLLHVVFG